MTYEVETKDGIVITGIPDHIKPDDPSIKAKVTNARQAQMAKNGVSGGDLMQAGIDPTEGNGFLKNAAIGLGKAAYDTGRGIKQLGAEALNAASPKLVSDQTVADLRQQIDRTKAQDEPLMNTGGGVTGNIAGNIGMALAPGGVLKGASIGARTLGATGAAEGLQVAGGAAMVPKTMLGAAGQGAAMGAIQPVGTEDSRGMNVGLGAGLGAAIPATAAVYRGAKSLIDPLTETGRAKILGRALQEASGGDAQLLTKLRNARELVPGSAPTVGEATNNASIAALQRSAFASTPEVKNAVVERGAQQNTARVGELLDLAGSSGQRQAAVDARETISGQFFKDARKEGIDPQVAAMLKPQIDNLMERMPTGVLEKAKELARIKGETMGAEGSVSGLHSIKKAVDDLIDGAAMTGMGKQTKSALLQYKGDLLKTLEDLSPKYMQGSRSYRAYSAPINAMDTAAEIAKRSVGGINDRLTPAAYARALRDETAQAATGFQGSTLANTLEPKQLARLQAIKDDLRRADFANNAGRAGSDTVEKLAYNNMLAQTGVPNFLRSFAPTQFMGNVGVAGANLLYGGANKTLQKQLANALLDPKEAAKLLEAATPSKRAALVAALTRNTLQPTALAAPAMLNANQ